MKRDWLQPFNSAVIVEPTSNGYEHAACASAWLDMAPFPKASPTY